MDTQLLPLSIETMASRLPWFCEPTSLQQRPEYLKGPDWAWLYPFLAAQQAVLHYFSAAPVSATAERAAFEDLVRAARECSARNFAWVEDQLARELSALVADHSSLSWVDALQDRVVGELWYVLNRRDAIQVILDAGTLLGLPLVFDEALVSAVAGADLVMREVAARLPDLPEVYGALETRARLYPKTHWWWLPNHPDRDAPPGGAADMISNYSRVRFLTDRFEPDGIRAGDVGYVIEVRSPDAYEIEISDPEGNTRALIVAREKEVEVFEPPDEQPE